MKYDLFCPLFSFHECWKSCKIEDLFGNTPGEKRHRNIWGNTYMEKLEKRVSKQPFSVCCAVAIIIFKSSL